jgi:plasmid stabilization system protein ParE
MRVRWTMDAADDLERICDYIAESRPESARRVAQSVVERVGTLEAFPQLGRSGRVEVPERSPSLRFHSLRFTRSLRVRVKFGCSGSYTAPNSGHQASWSREQAARA